MSGLLDGVNRRTQLAGYNRLELLLFFLDGDQHYGINVFKVHEVIQRPPMTRVPNANHMVVGKATLRGKTIPVIALAMAIGRHPLPDCAGGSLFLTAFAHVEKQMVEMIDVEKVLGNINGNRIDLAEKFTHGLPEEQVGKHVVLVVDDSSMARNQAKRTLERIGVLAVLTNNGKEAYELLAKWADDGDPNLKNLLMVISDIEMPEMDGYTLTTKIRGDNRLRDLYVMLHTSLSGLFNHNLIEKVDANAFVPKFDANDLARAVLDKIRGHETETREVH